MMERESILKQIQEIIIPDGQTLERDPVEIRIANAFKESMITDDNKIQSYLE